MIKANVDSSEWKDLYNAYNNKETFSIPKMYILNKKGEVLKKGIPSTKDSFIDFITLNPDSKVIDFPVYKSDNYDKEIKKQTKFDSFIWNQVNKKWNLGITLGCNFSKFSNTYTNPVVGYRGGILYEHHVGKFVFQPGIFASSTGGKSDNTKLIRHNIEIPFAITFDVFSLVHNQLNLVWPHITDIHLIRIKMI